MPASDGVVAELPVRVDAVVGQYFVILYGRQQLTVYLLEPVGIGISFMTALIMAGSTLLSGCCSALTSTKVKG
jgi:hypothetical protein